MLSQKDQKKIGSKLSNIYKSSLSKKDLYHLKNEIIHIINIFNKKNKKKKKDISEKTSLIISYGDSVYSSQKGSIKVFHDFFRKNL